MSPRALVLSICLILAAAPAAGDAPTTRPPYPTDLLGPKFSSKAYGLEFRPPADCTEIHKPTPDSVVEFVRDDYNWHLKVWRLRLERSLPLTIHDDQFGQRQDGVLENTVDRLQSNLSGAKILRNEVITVGRARVGMIAVRYDAPTHQRRLAQEAIVEVPDADQRLYYFLEFTGPAKPASEPEDIVNPAEKLAGDTFAQVVDSLTLLDRTDIANDQIQRLYQSRALFAAWSGDHAEPLRAALIPQQWQRIIRDGQDIGYSCAVEDADDKNKPTDNSQIHIAVRSRLIVSPTAHWDTLTKMACSLDRKHEGWSTAAKCAGPKGDLLDSFEQMATSDEQTQPVVIQPQIGREGHLGGDNTEHGLSGQGNVDIRIVRTLEVNTTHRTVQLNPFKIEVPAFYIPQAISYLLPSLLPLDHPKTYMFAVFVPDTQGATPHGTGGQVMARYVDVLPIQQVSFNGQTFQAVQIVDKITLEGPPTLYYYTPDGKLIGSTSTYTQDDKPTTLMVLPTDAATLQRLWKNPDLSLP
ncbi:MAG: hypothetical protein ABR964_10875 [Tepidisphaeraceae bacterium]|jgi:hypothetical protein